MWNHTLWESSIWHVIAVCPLALVHHMPLFVCVSPSVVPFVTPGTVARQAPLSMEFSRQEYWSGLPCPSPGDLPDAGPEPGSPALQGDSLASEPPGKPIHCSTTPRFLFVSPALWHLESFLWGLLCVSLCGHLCTCHSESMLWISVARSPLG